MPKIALVITMKNTHQERFTGVWGEEIVANALCKGINSLGVECEVCGFNEIDKIKKSDVAIHYTDMIHPGFFCDLAKKNILYIQGVKYKDHYSGKLHDIEDHYLAVRGRYDMVITSSTLLADRYGIPFLPACVDFDYYHPVDNGGYKYDITHIGNFIKPKGLNERYVAPMAQFNYELFGGHFGKLSHEDGLKVIAQSKINLNYSFEENIKYDMVLGRVMHISACQGFTLSDPVPTFTRMYKDAVAFTTGRNDEIEKIKYYLANDNLRREMAKNAYQITKDNFSHLKVAADLLKIKGVV